MTNKDKLDELSLWIESNRDVPPQTWEEEIWPEIQSRIEAHTNSQINNILVELREQVESLIDINNGVIGEQTIGAISALKKLTQLINSIMERIGNE